MKITANSIIFLLATTLFFFPTLKSQDIFFTQFQKAPLILNPALTGMFEGEHRLGLNYRNQWPEILGSSSYKSTSLSYDTKLTVSDQTKIGLGLNANFDSAGNLDYRSKRYNVLFSYGRRLWHNSTNSHWIILGASAGLADSQIDLTDARWPSQHDGDGGFNPELPGGEVDNTQLNYADLAIGAQWKAEINNRLSFNLGAAAHHINRADISFLESDSTEARLTMRKSLHGSGEIKISESFSLGGSFLYLSQGVHRMLMPGISAQWHLFKNNNQNYIELGFWKRYGKSINDGWVPNANIFTAALQISQFSLGLSYDVTTFQSNQPVVEARAYELSLGYIINRED